MWQLQNLYNSPANQMNLMRQAGLNPNMAYGSLGSAVAPQLQSAGSQTFSDSPVQVPNVASMYMQQKNQDVQNELIEREIKAKELENTLKEKELSYYDQRRAEERNIAEQTFKNMQATYSQILEQNSYIASQRNGQDIVNYINENSKDAQVQHILNQLDLDDANKRYIEKQIAVAQSVIGLNNAQKQNLIDQHYLFDMTKGQMIEAINSANALETYMNKGQLGKEIIVDKYLGFNPVAFMDDVNTVGRNQAVINAYGFLTDDGKDWLGSALGSKIKYQNSDAHNYGVNDKTKLEKFNDALSMVLWMSIARGGFKTGPWLKQKPIGFGR